jgi:hypothetical protein
MSKQINTSLLQSENIEATKTISPVSVDPLDF